MPRIHIRLTEEQLAQIDAVARLRGVTRTALLTDRWPLERPPVKRRPERSDKIE